jgi:ATP-binding cassette subfamily B multidrug efflux pump
MKALIRISRFLKPYWLKSLLSTIFLLCVVFLDLAIPRLVQQVIDQGITPGNLTVVKQTTLIMLGVSFLNMLLAIIYNTLSVYVSEAFARDLREAVFQKIQDFSYKNLDSLRTGNLIVRLTSDVSVLQNTVRMSLRFGIRAPLIIIGSLALMFATDSALALKVLPLLLLTIVVVWFFISRLGPLFLRVQKRLDNLNMVLQENIAGVRVVKAFAQRRHEEERFETANEAFTKMHIRIMRFHSSFSPALTMLINLAIVLVVWRGGFQSIKGSLSLGAIVAFTDYLMTALAPLTLLVMLANALAAGIASAERLCEVFDTKTAIQDAPSALPFPEKMDGEVAFNHVSFYYDGADGENILDDIDFHARPGQTVAILGATGSGKSTLVNLIPRFYEVTAGSITIDGFDIRQITQESLLSIISITPQDTILFSGTVRENIAYGKPDADFDDVILAAKVAQAHDFIMELPDGYHTLVAQRGVNLSGGQKQRISIARAVLRRPKILILDDSTSAVDVETETKIQTALREYIKGSTCFIVAQRISTVLSADKIIVLEKGKIAAQGTHAELIKNSPIYKEIYDSQLGDGNHLVQDQWGKNKLAGAAANG